MDAPPSPPRPRIGISRCLLGEDVRFDGGHKRDPFLKETIGRFVESVLGIITELISLIFMITRRDHKAIHDLVAGTVVLYDPDKVLAKWPASSQLR